MYISTGTTVLCNSYADVDATNKNYYGEQHLHYLDAVKQDSCQVPNLEKGPIHDVRWSPKGDFFAVVAGFMPAKTLLFNSQCKPIFDFGSGPHNLIRWSPHGRFLCVAGFGNLPGKCLTPGYLVSELRAYIHPRLSCKRVVLIYNCKDHVENWGMFEIIQHEIS